MSEIVGGVIVGSGNIVTFKFENAGQGLLAGGVTTLGQSFAQGEVPAGSGLVARIGSTTAPVQVDVKTIWPDGSAKMAIVSVERPDLAAGVSMEVALSRAAAPSGPVIDLAQALDGHSFVVDLAAVGRAPMQIDVLSELQKALTNNTASFWQKGELATEARVEIAIPNSSERFVFDVTAWKGGGITVDAQFNNDRAMEAIGGRVDYSITARLDGAQVLNRTVSQAQYQNWVETFSTTTGDGGQSLGSPTSGWLNIRHDVAKLGQLGVVADYDLTLKIPESELAQYRIAISDPSWNAPLASNGVERYMPSAGARADIGITTEANTDWLISGDVGAAAYALGQAKAASSVPWHFRDLDHNTWVSIDDYPRLWTDPRGGTGSPGDQLSTGLTQQREDWSTLGWETDLAHQPDLSFVPYMLTGQRWMLDNLTAQGAANLIQLWNFPRQDGTGIIVNTEFMQTRSAAWAMRQIENAALAAPDGSVEKAYFTKIADTNWKWIADQLPKWTAEQGEAYGWLPTYEKIRDLTPWQQDFFASTAISAASRGNADALSYINWAKNFLIGRFEAMDKGFNIRDGVAFVLHVRTADGAAVFKTWAEIGVAAVQDGLSNGTGWEATVGDMGRLALASLAGIYDLTGDQRAFDAYQRLIALAPPGTSRDALASRPQWSVGLHPPESGPPPSPPSEPLPPHLPVGDEMRVMKSPILDVTIDMGDGKDHITLSSTGSNGATLANVETVIGGSANDAVTLSTAMGGGLVDLRDGADILTLAAGNNTLSVANTEKLIGGDGNDDVTLLTPLSGGVIDLKDGNDRLILADGDNTVTVYNVELFKSGSDNDTISLGTTPVLDALVDLGAGLDRLVLASEGPNRLTVLNAETMIGSRFNDAVTVRVSVNGVLIDLWGGFDNVILHDDGGTVRLRNVEAVLGGHGNDKVIFETVLRKKTIDLSGGFDVMQLSSAGANYVTVASTEAIYGGSQNDTIILTTPLTAPGALVDLGAGNDEMRLCSDGPNMLSVAAVETIRGGLQDDTITLLTPSIGSGINLGAGRDQVILSSKGPNSVTLTNVEAVIGGDQNDTGTFTNAVRDVSVDLRGGYDVLRLSSISANQLTVANVEYLQGGHMGDTVTMSAGAWGMVVDLGGGRDVLQLANVNNFVAVRNVEVVRGGTADDTIKVVGSIGAWVKGAAGDDKIIGGDGNDTLTGGAGRDELAGGLGADHFRFTAASNSPLVNHDLVWDFAPIEDHLVFDGMLKGVFAWRGSADFTGSGNSEARVASTGLQTLLQVDLNGDGSGDMAIGLMAVKPASLSTSSFIWA